MQKNKIGPKHEIKMKYVKEILKMLSKFKNIIFKGGTALSLTYEEINRFSEDIDLDLIKDDNLSNSKNIINLINDIVSELKKKEWIINNDKEWIIDGLLYDKGKIINRNNDNKIHPKLTLNFKNNGKNSIHDQGFDENKIVIEFPNFVFKKNQDHFNFIKPYENANFKMNVMKKEFIFADKCSIIIEKFCINNGFDWAINNRADGRHIYDVLVLKLNNDNLKINDSYILERNDKIIFKKNPPFIRGKKDEKVKRWILFINLSNEKVWFIFKQEFKNKELKIKQKIEKLVYPGFEKFNSNKFLKIYKPLFLFMFKKIKKNFIAKSQKCLKCKKNVPKMEKCFLCHYDL